MIKLKHLIKENVDDSDMKKKLEALRQSLLQAYPQIRHLFISASSKMGPGNVPQNVLTIDNIEIKPEFRKQGIGSKIIDTIKKFADDNGMIITLSPEPQRGYKKKLDQFYKGHGFKYNTGRHKDYSLSSF